MPAPEAYSTPHGGRPALGHVNLMVDTFIANAQVDDLRSIVRGLLASGIPNIGSTFTTLAQARCFYGAGLAFSGLRVLTGMTATMARALTELDTDISQAIQSSKEQIECDRLAALEIMQDLKSALLESKSDVESWKGEFPVEYWKM
ncbi:hypothetical protein BDZ89DRAFT_1103032 [Hymenopellis radicata]|nr:hypothetical protein BDZ89DRAFT_1103032 [Hymenopellis radicata]